MRRQSTFWLILIVSLAQAPLFALGKKTILIYEDEGVSRFELSSSKLPCVRISPVPIELNELMLKRLLKVIGSTKPD